jgi:hypothetical protein
MMENLTDLAYFFSRYFHIIATALIGGGTLFYLWVVPFAIGELKEESQKVVFARARLVFRWIVFISALLLLISGAFMTARSIPVYKGLQVPAFRELARIIHPAAPPTADLDHPTIFEKPFLWFVAHIAGAFLCLIIAVALVRGGTPPNAPVFWMRLNFVLLLITILIAVIGRNARTLLYESINPYSPSPSSEIHE